MADLSFSDVLRDMTRKCERDFVRETKHIDLTAAGYDGTVGGRDKARSHFIWQYQKQEAKRDEKLLYIQRLSQFKDFVESGLMTVSDAVTATTAREGHDAMIASAHVRSQPAHDRLHRERCAEINNENDRRERSRNNGVR
jgi:hypothetical protein